MIKYNEARWNNIIKNNIPFDYIKSIVKDKYNNVIRESNVVDFKKNINTYKKIDEFNLLNEIEENFYNRLAVFSIKRYKKNTSFPICDDIQNMAFNDVFKSKNRINMDSNEYYEGELDQFYSVVYYNIVNEQFTEIKLSRLREEQFTKEDDGDIETITEEIYDTCKFVIDCQNTLVFMFYNDFIVNDNICPRAVTEKKEAFRNLFPGVSNKNILKYNIDNYLNKYFFSYMKEINENNPCKLITIIKTLSFDGESSLKSINYNYEHRKSRLEAINDDVKNHNHTIAEIECNINDVLVNLKHVGELSCNNSCFSKEVIEDVCKEFFEDYKFY